MRIFEKDPKKTQYGNVENWYYHKYVKPFVDKMIKEKRTKAAAKRGDLQFFGGGRAGHKNYKFGYNVREIGGGQPTEPAWEGGAYIPRGEEPYEAEFLEIETTRKGELGSLELDYQGEPVRGVVASLQTDRDGDWVVNFKTKTKVEGAVRVGKGKKAGYLVQIPWDEAKGDIETKYDFTLEDLVGKLRDDFEGDEFEDLYEAPAQGGPSPAAADDDLEGL